MGRGATVEPLIITAHMGNAYSAADPWSPSIDGILAYWALREQHGEEWLALGMAGHREIVEAELPLARDEHGDWWWWQCSSPLVEVERRFVQFHHRRFDDLAAATYLPERTKKILTAGGPYKTSRTGKTRHLTHEIVWHVVGDAAEIERLLRRCHSIGFGHSRGYGQVRGWMVAADGDADIARFHRPLPEGFASQHGIVGSVMRWGIRPPGRHPAFQAMCVMPA